METAALTSLLQDYPYAAYLLGTLVLIGVAIKSLRSIFDFHNDFTRRHFRRVSELLPQTEAGSDLQHFLRHVIADEVFKIASGVAAPRRKAALLMQLCRNDYLSPNQIRPVAHFIKQEADGLAEIQISFADKLFAWYALGSSLLVLGYGAVSFILLVFKHGASGALVGAIVFAMCGAACVLFSGDFRNYRSAKQLERELASRPLPPIEEPKPATPPTLDTLHSVNKQTEALNEPA
jgi:hypothetical protein